MLKNKRERQAEEEEEEAPEEREAGEDWMRSKERDGSPPMTLTETDPVPWQTQMSIAGVVADPFNFLEPGASAAICNQALEVYGTLNPSAAQINAAFRLGTKKGYHALKGCAGYLHWPVAPVLPLYVGNTLSCVISSNGRHLAFSGNVLNRRQESIWGSYQDLTLAVRVLGRQRLRSYACESIIAAPYQTDQGIWRTYSRDATIWVDAAGDEWPVDLVGLEPGAQWAHIVPTATSITLSPGYIAGSSWQSDELGRVSEFPIRMGTRGSASPVGVMESAYVQICLERTHALGYIDGTKAWLWDGMELKEGRTYEIPADAPFLVLDKAPNQSPKGW